MEKIKFEISLSDEQKAYKDKLFKEMMKNKHVIAFMKEYNVDKAYIYDHCGKISDWVKQCEICDRCVGLDFCKMSMKGHFRDLLIDDGLLIEEMHRCQYQKNQDALYAHQEQYKIFDAKSHYLLIDMEEFDPAKETNTYMKAVDKAVDFLENPQKGLYLYGQPGVGKTYLMAGITNRLAKKGRKIAFVNVPKYLSELKMLFKDAEAFDRKVRSLKRIDILVLDDIGGESVTAWSRDEILLPLLDERMEKGKITLFTSNYSMKELEERLTITNNTLQEPMAAKRLLDRIKALSCELFVKGSSRR